MRGALSIGVLLAALLGAGCNNNPWPDGQNASNTLHSGVQESSPRHLDPTASYWNNETPFTYNIYEPLYAYHYLKRPYQLVPKSAAAVAKLLEDGKTLLELAAELIVLQGHGLLVVAKHGPP